MDTAAHFSQTYAEARDKFLDAAASRGARIERHVHPEQRGALGEPLSMDVARLGTEDARGLLLLSSGTHGVEGFCGSGCQVSLLHDRRFTDAVEQAGVAVLMVHAVNPYGFSHLRRANEDNADLNRNFAAFDADPPRNHAYAELHELLLPDTWAPPPQNEAKIGAWIAAHGLKAYQAAVSGGQHEFADGLFYAGARPSWSNKTLRSVLREHAAKHPRMGWIDLHTGLGPSGHGEKIYGGRDEPAGYARACEWWGDVTSVFDGSSSSARVSGVACSATYDECPRTEAALMALEYGTLPIEQVLEALRAEHWLNKHPDAPDAQRRAIKAAMRDAFYVDTDEWKERVYAQALAASLRAVERLDARSAVSARFLLLL